MSSARGYVTESNEDNASRPTRAAKACRRCHRKKLRCFGGLPCSRCKTAHQSCDFAEETHPDRISAEDSSEINLARRFNDLEKLVQTIIERVTPGTSSSMSFDSSNVGGLNSHDPVATHTGPSTSQICLMAGNARQDFDPGVLEPASLHMAIPQSAAAHDMPFQNSDDPSNLFNTNEYQPNEVLMGRSPSPIPPPLAQLPRNRNQGSAEGRMALLAQMGSRYSAPLRPLSFQPAHWENADHTRPPSPSREDDGSGHDFWQSVEVRPSLADDPVSLGWIDSGTADQLVNL